MASKISCLSFDGDTKTAHVQSVYDGDSCTVEFALHGVQYAWKCRLAGIDTPELRTKNLYEKKIARQARDELRRKILGKDITIRCGKFDKYGRLLITPYLEGEDICIWLITENHARKYDGGRRGSWPDPSASQYGPAV